MVVAQFFLALSPQKPEQNQPQMLAMVLYTDFIMKIMQERVNPCQQLPQ
jgi:hypothetical protein